MVITNYGEQIRGLFKVFSNEQIYVLGKAREACCTDEQIDFLANPSFSDSVMSVFLSGIKGGVSLEQLNQYTKFEYNEISEIIYGLVTDKLSREQVGIYAKEIFNQKQMFQIRVALKQGLSLEKVMSFAKPEYSWESMNVIRNGIKEGLSQEKIDKILLGVEKGLSLEEVYLIMENDYNCEQIEELILGFLRGEAYEVKVFAKPCFNSRQMREIRLGFEDGLDKKQILAYANPDLSAENMYKIRKKLKKRR